MRVRDRGGGKKGTEGKKGSGGREGKKGGAGVEVDVRLACHSEANCKVS